MNGTMGGTNSDQERVLLSLDIEDDKMFLLHFIIGTYFGPDLTKHHPKKQSAFQIQSSTTTKENLPTTRDELSGSLMKRAELQSIYHHVLKNADPSLILKPRPLRKYFNGKRSDDDHIIPLFADLFPPQLHPVTRVGNQYKLIKSIVFINDPDTSCMRGDCVERFKRLTGLQSFNIDVTVSSVEDKIDHESLKEDVSTCVSREMSGAEAGTGMGLVDIGECNDAYLFRIGLPGVKRDERDFSCVVEEDGKVIVRGVNVTGEKRVTRFCQVFEMQTQNLCPPGEFSVTFRLPGPVYPQEFAGSFGTDGIFEGIVLKNLQKKPNV